MKGLTETIMEEEASEYSMYDKTASSYMFGAAMSSGFGSGFNGGGSGYGSGFGTSFGVGTGYVYDKIKVDNVDLTFRLRVDDDFKIGSHLNDEILAKKDTLSGRDSYAALINLHHLFDWNK
ncbi:MAG: hypothetical protein V1914_04160 [archaeon]